MNSGLTQRSNDRTMVWVFEKSADVIGGHRTNVTHLLKPHRVRGHQSVQRAEFPCQPLCRRLADFANTQCIEKARQSSLARSIDGGQQIGSRFFGHALQS